MSSPVSNKRCGILKGQRRVSLHHSEWQSADAVPIMMPRKSTITSNEPPDDNASSVAESEIGDTHEIYVLPHLQAFLQGTVMEDAITKLRILVSCNNEMKITKLESDMPKYLAIKYNIAQPAYKDELDGIDVKRLNCSEYKLNKLDADRNFVVKVFNDTYVDLVLNKGFKALTDHVNSITDRDNYFSFLIDDEANNRIVRRDLNKQLRQQRNHFKSVLYDTEVIIDNLKTEVEDAALNADIRSRYVDNWQVARTEQHIQTIFNKENVYGEVIDYYKTRSDHEQRVHTEVELLINIAINETLGRVEKWMDKYDADMEAIDLRIQIKKNDYKNMWDKRVDLEHTIEKHEVLMKDWVHFKEEREKERKYRETMTKSAIIVQAWWRGILVRLQLGPFKVKKKPKAAKKK